MLAAVISAMEVAMPTLSAPFSRAPQRTWAAFYGAAVLLLGVSTLEVARAAEIKVLSTVAVKAVMEELIPRFERSSGHAVSIEFGTSAALRRQIDAGGRFDVFIVTPPETIDDLIQQDKVATGTRTDFARTSVGVAVRTGTPKPDIGSVDAFKRALVSARSVGYTDPARGGTSGLYLAGLIERLGISAELKSKTKLSAGIPALVEALAGGDIEIGMLQISEIVPDNRLELVGPLPGELEKTTVIAAGVLTNSAQPEASRALIKFLMSPAAVSVMKEKGMEAM
jgi:molybdate transport system substrate-binding protein